MQCNLCSSLAEHKFYGSTSLQIVRKLDEGVRNTEIENIITEKFTLSTLCLLQALRINWKMLLSS